MKGQQRQQLPSSPGALDATSKVPFPLWDTEARQHKRDKDVASDVCWSCCWCCCPWDLGLPSLQKCACEKFLAKFDLEFDLKFEISDKKNLVKFGGRTFLPARKAREISGRISGQISETSFQISRLFLETSLSTRRGCPWDGADLSFRASRSDYKIALNTTYVM